MVRLHVKCGEGDREKEFLYDCRSSEQTIEGILREILQISNLQLGIDTVALQLEPSLAAASYGSDQKATGLIRALSEAKAYASKDQVVHGRPLLYHVLRDHVRAVEKELNVISQLPGSAVPEKLQQVAAEQSEIFQFTCDLGSSFSNQCRLDGLCCVEQLQMDNSHLWWAGKELMRDKQLCYYIGINEKTKITVRLQSDG